MKTFFLALLVLTACSKHEAPRPKTKVQIVLPKELKSWINLSDLSFPLPDGSDSSPEIIVLTPKEALEKLPSGEIKPNLWITSNTEHANIVAREVRNLGVTPKECEPLFQSSVIVTSDEKTLHELKEPVDISSLKGNIWIESPASSSVFVNNLNPEKTHIFPQGALPRSILRHGDYIVTNRLFASGLNTSNSPSIYSLCLLEHPLIDGREASASRAVFSRLKTLPRPEGAEPVIGTDNLDRTLPAKKDSVIFLDATGSLADSGFGGLQRFALGLVNSVENFSLTVASYQTRVTSNRDDAVRLISSQRPQGESNSFETLRELISKNKTGYIWILTDVSFLKDQKGLITLLENASKFSKAYVFIYAVGEDDPVLNVLNEFPGVWVLNDKEKKAWEELFQGFITDTNFDR